MDWIKEERPLSDWTLADVKAFCRNRVEDKITKAYECCGCPLHGKVCDRSPDAWDLEARYEP